MMKKLIAPMFALFLIVLLAGTALAAGQNSPVVNEGEWIGAPCMSDDDCGNYKCCSGACAESCYSKELKVGTWIGAPCLSNDDCGDYKCCSGACAENCFSTEIQVSESIFTK